MNSLAIWDLIEDKITKHWSLIIIILLLFYSLLIINKITLRFLKTHLNTIFSTVSKKEFIFSTVVQSLLAILITFKFTFDESNISMLLTVSSIFCALLLNLLILVYDLFQKLQERILNNKNDGGILVTLNNIQKSLKELYRNIGLLIFESILIIVISSPFMLGFTNKTGIIILTILILYLSLVFIKQLFETIKQVFNLIIISL